MVTHRIAVWPDGFVCNEEDIEKHPYLSDDYQLRGAGWCERCQSEITPEYGEPIANCNCTTQEWYS